MHAICKFKRVQIGMTIKSIGTDLGHAVFDDDTFDKQTLLIPRLVIAVPIVRAADTFQRQHAFGVKRPKNSFATLAGAKQVCGKVCCNIPDAVRKRAERQGAEQYDKRQQKG